MLFMKKIYSFVYLLTYLFLSIYLFVEKVLRLGVKVCERPVIKNDR